MTSERHFHSKRRKKKLGTKVPLFTSLKEGIDKAMAVYVLEMAVHVAVTITAVVTLAIRLEHRLTKIETDVAWLKKWMLTERKEFCDVDED